MKNAFAVACTGRGEHFVRSNLVGALTRRLEKSSDVERALRKVLADGAGIMVEWGSKVASWRLYRRLVLLMPKYEALSWGRVHHSVHGCGLLAVSCRC